MKKQMIALAVAGAFAGSAFAANVDMYGVVDTGLVYTQTEVGGVLSSAKAEGHKFSMDSGVNAGNRFACAVRKTWATATLCLSSLKTVLIPIRGLSARTASSSVVKLASL